MGSGSAKLSCFNDKEPALNLKVKMATVIWLITTAFVSDGGFGDAQVPVPSTEVLRTQEVEDCALNDLTSFVTVNLKEALKSASKRRPSTRS